MNSEVQPRRGLKSALETARVVFARVYRLHPSAHNFAPIERQRERKRGAKGLVAQQRDEQRRTKIARLSACVRLYERVDERVKDNNKRETNKDAERKRERMLPLDTRRSMLYTARNIRYDGRISEKGNALENKFLRIFVFFLFFFFYGTIYGEKNRVLGFEEERIFLVIEFLY